MTSLRRRAEILMEEVFESLDLPVELARVTYTNRPDLADFQCNGALAAAKRVGRDPMEIAAEIADALRSRTINI